MKHLTTISLALTLALTALPALAQSNGSAPVAGEGPGGSGAGQSTAGPSKTPPAAPAADSTMMKKPTADAADPMKSASPATGN